MENYLKERFRKFAHITSTVAGSPWAFSLAVLSILSWALLGPKFHYSDTWQLVINTSTTIITFLMVFLIQNTQNRDNKSLELKIDELIRANKHARNQLINLEKLSDQELDKFHEELCKLNEETEQKIKEVHHHQIKKKKKTSFPSQEGT